MKDFHKGIRRFCTILLGLVFFTAGMLKLMDPVGSGLVIREYYHFFHTEWLAGTAKSFGFIMAMIESLTGAALLAGVWRKYVAVITSVLTGFFTILTFILLVTDSQMDCGCFGEAIHLSTLATFIKNVVLCALCALAFLPIREYTATRPGKLTVFIMEAIIIVAFGVYELGHLPLMDFTEFAPGASLVSADEDSVQKGASDSSEEIYVIYEKDGKEGLFTLDRLPDSTWTFVGVKELDRTYADYEDSTPTLSISDAEGNYCESMLHEGNVMVITIYDTERFDGSDAASAAHFMEAAEAAGFKTVVIARAPVEGLEDVYTADFKKVITINRSNGGATWISDGEIIAKWTANDRPDAAELQKLSGQNDMEYMVKKASKGRIWYQGIMLYSLAILLLI